MKVFSSSSNEHEGDYNVCVIAATKNAPYCPPPPPPIGNPGMMTVLCLHLRPIMPTVASGYRLCENQPICQNKNVPFSNFFFTKIGG